jgi:hypothetical protein
MGNNMLKRTMPKKQFDIMIINDVPVKFEIESGDKFSAISNLNLLTSLRVGQAITFNAQKIDGYKEILSTNVYKTYVDYSYYGENVIEGNFDFNKEFRKHSEILSLDDYVALPHKKDLFISKRLNKEISSLLDEIRLCQPKFIIITGKWGLFFLTGLVGLGENLSKAGEPKPLGAMLKYRASILKPFEGFSLPECVIYPMIHTIHHISMPDKVPIMDMDIQRCSELYHHILENGVNDLLTDDITYILGTTKPIVLDYLNNLLKLLDNKPMVVSVDIETMFLSFIDCIGLAYKENEGICIPFATRSNPNYWSIEDEIEISLKLFEVLNHKNIRHLGQNYAFDCQYFKRQYLLDIFPAEDTLVLHHTLYAYLPKSLSFLASLYCKKYTYWKDEIDAPLDDPARRWRYNIKDVCYTLQIFNILEKVILAEDRKLYELYRFTIGDLQKEAIITMNKGVRVDKDRKDYLFNFYSSLMDEIRVRINEILGFEFNPNSVPQKKKLFKEFFGMSLKKKRRKGKESSETMDREAMLDYIIEYPMYAVFLKLLVEFNAIKTFTKTFLGMKLDIDDRARTQYKVASTVTGRLASVKNVFGSGGNLMNLPTGGKTVLHSVLDILNWENKEVFDNFEEYLEVIFEEISEEIPEELEF